jgi:Protein of unknown function (DUF3307)
VARAVYLQLQVLKRGIVMFYLFLLAHLVADFILQPYWLVVRKRRWDGLLLHGTIVLVCMLALPLTDHAALALWPAMLVITAIHVVADWWKVRFGNRVPGPPIGPFMLDQAIHITTLAVVLSLLLPTEQVWTLAASPVAPLAIWAAAYIVAACATPIAVMIWLDPLSQHAALAGPARWRSLLVGAGAVSLAVIGGALALPATLLGLLVAARRRRVTTAGANLAAHPLETPLGLLTVLCVAAALGAGLAMIH